MDDELNPDFLFGTAKTALLIALLNSGTDLNELAIKELINRGVNTKKRIKCDNFSTVSIEEAKR